MSRTMEPSASSRDPGQAVLAIRDRWNGMARVGVVLGTGLGDLAAEIDAQVSLPYGSIPGFPSCSALAHAGRLVCGTLAGIPLIALQGRCHLYEGYSLAEVAFPTSVLAALGVRTLIVTNAAGGLHPRMAIGDVMLIDDHIHLQGFGGSWRLDPDSLRLARMPRPHSRLYDAELGERASVIARGADVELRRGVYVGVTGPTYETRAEYRAFRRIGGDAVGMSTIAEVLIARSLGLRVIGLSTITNVARPDAPQVVSAENVAHVAASALPKVRLLVRGLIQEAQNKPA
ncbi:MAG: purine-nucleoside phosphorylase [Pirellulaceae bacterium]|nr:purine-nucleoside phosphorylase [Pirellulaceae bacterium]